MPLLLGHPVYQDLFKRYVVAKSESEAAADVQSLDHSPTRAAATDAALHRVRDEDGRRDDPTQQVPLGGQDSVSVAKYE